MDPQKAVATIIAAAREKASMTQAELASRLERPHSVIGTIESNQRQINVPAFIAIPQKSHLLSNIRHKYIAPLFLDREFGSRAADSGVACARVG